MIKLLLFYCSIILTSNLFSQSLPIFLDGKTDDWNIPVPTYNDTENDGNVFDFKYFSVTNDEQFLFIRLNFTPEAKLIENNLLTLYIDGDNNIATGVSANGIGAELRWDFGNRTGQFFKNGTTNISFPEIQFRTLPTVTDTTYEVAIGRNVLPNGSDPLFSSPSIKIFIKDNDTNGDWMPNNGVTFEYTFDNTPTTPLVLTEINREDTSLLRVMNWNVLFDGLLEPGRADNFERILQAIQPDIICFNEFFNSSATQVVDAINQILPLPGSASWYGIKLDAGNVSVSKYPFIQSWEVYSGHRITASLIDLPQYYEKDIMVINSHLKCCGGQQNDETRQLEADATIAFILDAKSAGGLIDLPANTPFLIAGDLNLVGLRQQLTTLTTGEIINTQIFGNGSPPDWDNTDLEDLLSQQTDKRSAYTWRYDNSAFPPGRLDFQIYSNSVINVEKDFVIQTEVMSGSRLAQYGLQQFDTRDASDHFPKVTDYSFNGATNINNETELRNFGLEQNYPNPFNPSTIIKFTIPFTLRGDEGSFVSLKVYDVLGNEIETLVNEQKPAGSYEIEFSGSDLTCGIYFYQLKYGELMESRKMILLK
ncbi:MAG: endonuclease/exonuclease/phosphatase family protein [Ignavibacteria bacterium]|nr:endonuclease/exonuclease/phosphatase family protein [Ignavibacteria bacterium]